MTTRLPSPQRAGFTLVELMVSMVLISLLSLMLVSMTNSTASTWRYTTAKIEQFRGAETAFEAMSRRLSQATLNTYWDYDSPIAPKKYLRQSDLRFIIGSTTGGSGASKPLLTTVLPRRPTHGVFFQAPLGFVDDATNFGGLSNLLNTWGYYLEFGKDSRPPFLDTMSNAPAQRYRYRLMEFMQPSNTLSVYKWTSGYPTYNAKDWFATPLTAGATGTAVTSPSHVLAENVIALVLLPKLSAKDNETPRILSKDYSYDSTTNLTSAADADINPKNQLPPIVQMTVVAIDETSAVRIANGSTPPTFDAVLDTIFLDSAKYDADLKLLQDTLTQAVPPISFRVFTTSVSIRGAKWSKN